MDRRHNRPPGLALTGRLVRRWPGTGLDGRQWPCNASGRSERRRRRRSGVEPGSRGYELADQGARARGGRQLHGGAAAFGGGSDGGVPRRRDGRGWSRYRHLDTRVRRGYRRNRAVAGHGGRFDHVPAGRRAFRSRRRGQLPAGRARRAEHRRRCVGPQPSRRERDSGIGRRFGAPVLVSGPGASAAIPRVAMDAGGNAIAIWAQAIGSDTIVQASRSPQGVRSDPSIPSPPVVTPRSRRQCSTTRGTSWRRGRESAPMRRRSPRSQRSTLPRRRWPRSACPAPERLAKVSGWPPRPPIAGPARR